MKRIGIVYHPLNKDALSLAQQLAQVLDARGVSYWLGSAWEADETQKQLPGTDLILTTGGDGTILRTAQAVASSPIPITGINLGKLGFMTELDAGEAAGKLADILAGDGWIEERAMLKAELSGTEPGPPREFLALNDVVVARGEVARIIYIEAGVNGQPLTTYNADGVITATATGSTGYSLAAGGPILHPEADEWLLVPILPHLSPDYSLVMPADAIVRLKIGTTHQATLSIDGHISLPLASGATITVKRSQQKIRFLRIRPRDYFYSSLQQKLRG